MDTWLVWLIVAGLFAAGEVATVDLTLAMFAGGALGSMVVALVGGPLALQVLAFVVVSAALLALVRPIAKRHLVERTPEQVDGAATLVGSTARVTVPIDVEGGRIKVGADEWTARSGHPGERFDAGTTVRILQIEGATAVVTAAPDPR